MHGGSSPGAPKVNQNAYKHGLYTGKAMAMKAMIRVLGKGHKNLMEKICE